MHTHAHTKDKQQRFKVAIEPDCTTGVVLVPSVQPERFGTVQGADVFPFFALSYQS